jgi:F1F0 ATPase subunit 2
MTDTGTISIAALASSFVLGMVLSGLYFGTLWFTLRRLVNRPRPGLFLLLSLLLRLSLLLGCFYLILHTGHWQQLLAALAGFMTLRILLMRKIKAMNILKHVRTDTEMTS